MDNLSKTADTGSLAQWTKLARSPLETARSWAEEFDAERSPGQLTPALARRVPLAMVTVAVVLLTIDEYGNSAYGESVLFSRVGEYWLPLAGLVWWGTFVTVGYIVIPSLLVRFFMPGLRVRDLHLSYRGAKPMAWTVAPVLLVAMPLVWAASQRSDFALAYPFYANAGRSTTDYLIWSVVYVAQFVGLEFFFRGFILASTRPVLGSASVWVMIVPYALIHIYKPYPEAIGAIIAGLALGFLAMRHRTIWDGVLIHVSVALAMDALAL